MNRLVFVCIFLITLFVSCNYRSTIQDSNEQTVSIQMIKDDVLGNLRSSLILELERSPLFSYVKKGGDIELMIEMQRELDEPIGFQYARQLQEITNRLVTNEKRIWMRAKVSMIDTKTKQLKTAPQEVLAAVEFDFDPEESDDKFTVIGPNLVPMVSFSLGELESEQVAKRKANELLLQKLAKRIVDYISFEKLMIQAKIEDK